MRPFTFFRVAAAVAADFARALIGAKPIGALGMGKSSRSSVAAVDLAVRHQATGRLENR